MPDKKRPLNDAWCLSSKRKLEQVIDIANKRAVEDYAGAQNAGSKATATIAAAKNNVAYRPRALRTTFENGHDAEQFSTKDPCR
jgi:hypothetical protein